MVVSLFIFQPKCVDLLKIITYIDWGKQQGLTQLAAVGVIYKL